MRIGEEKIKKNKKKERKKKIETTAAKYNGLSITVGGHKKKTQTDGSKKRTFHSSLRAVMKTKENRMWANAQPDGRPAEHRWRPLFNAAKFS